MPLFSFGRFFSGAVNGTRSLLDNEADPLILPHHRQHNAMPAKDVTKVALKLKYLIEAAVPCELKESHITRPHSPIITHGVVDLARNAAGTENKACVVFCLLICLRWFKRQALLEMYDADLNVLRAEACQVIAKKIIESTEDQEYLFSGILLQKFSILKNGEETTPANAVEKAIDLHATRVIGSSGYQKCITYLWKGWLVRDSKDPSQFTSYKDVANKSYWAHFQHDRMRAPVYQNAFQIFVSFVYLLLYTIAINTVDPERDIDIEEVFLYLFTFGFIIDEGVKVWKIGRYYLGFWNVFNALLYGTLTVTFVTRMLALGYPLGSPENTRYDVLSYNLLAFVAPMFWCRMLLYLDAIKFFGAMLVVLKVMMQESIIFFALLVVIIIGFLQAFVGMDNTEDKGEVTGFILRAMTNAILGSPEFDGFDNFSHPFGMILYYVFAFIVMVILLNILIALYNQAYTDITENAIDEYLALFSHKTMQFIRAPDENVFLAPFNIIEIFLLIAPFEWWMSKSTYSELNNLVMGVVYSPFLVIIAWIESRSAYKVRANRAKGEEDDDETEEWEELQGEVDILGDGWEKQVTEVVPDVDKEPAVVEILKLRGELEELRLLIKQKGEKWSEESESPSPTGTNPVA
ncbi:hypothetical protein L211DRAFT_881447 [Terfezia boudieri ATCC MYA-4762]|uniref:Uncharacterized protein n=1 Tax=Terfezia boudieri ATCC MYA-4762 TaxID=1051890 RepID=A0A3N4M1B3_9PEZI|nr:hypothetical protein L211DRAFT_881447 [Terfezia boudieri ATCC MYA-4762]